MPIEKMNMLQSSKNYDGTTLETFLRGMDNQQALGRYILDKGDEMSFFKNFPGLMAKQLSDSDRVGDIIYIDEKFNVVGGGPGLPGPFKDTRQLAGNEDIVNAGYRRDKMSVGIYRYAVAMENYLQTDLLPGDVVSYIKSALTRWATHITDTDIQCTLFRDYPYYYAELDGLTSTEVSERVEPLFGRGTYNDVDASPLHIMPNGVTDIEALSNTDTLSDTFLRYLQQFADQELGMKQLGLEDGRPFFGLICGDPDVQYFYDNSTSQFKTDLNSSFQGTQWANPIFKKFLGEYAGIRLTKYGWMSANDGRDEFSNHMSVYKHLMGSPYEPIAKVLAGARGDETIPDLITRTRGAYDMTTPGNRNGLTGDGNEYNLYISLGATHFPYYMETGSSFVGKESYNSFELTPVECANAYCGLAAGDQVGRVQVGESEVAGMKFKVLYSGPVFVGNIQLAPNKTKYGQVQKLYRMRVHALYTWDGAAWQLVSNANIATAFNTFKTFLGLDGSNKIQIGGAFGGVEYQKRRKVHVFNTIRSVLFGEMLMYEADLLKGAKTSMETRDYGALTGWGITMSRGRKLAQSVDGSIRNYAVVSWKRPSVI